MQRLEVSGAVRPLQWSLGVKGLTEINITCEANFQQDVFNATWENVHKSRFFVVKYASGGNAAKAARCWQCGGHPMCPARPARQARTSVRKYDGALSC